MYHISFCVLCALRTSARTIHNGATVILRLLLVAGLACGWSAQHCALRWLLLFVLNLISRPWLIVWQDRRLTTDTRATSGTCMEWRE